jgi:hypothetical protein
MIGGNLPRRGYSGPGDSLAVEAKQSLEERIHDSPLGLSSDQSRVECLGFSPIDENEIRTLAMSGATRRHQKKC